MPKSDYIRGIIFLNGDFDEPGEMPFMAKDLIICADGGLGHIRRLGLVPHVAIGDFDSLNDEDIAYLQSHKGGIKVLEFPSEKDYTDGQLALEYALDAGVKEVIIYGGFGGRIDHTLANIFMAKLCLDRGATMRLVSKGQQLSMLKGPTSTNILGNPGDYISLIPLSPKVIGITTEGLRYPLHNATMKFGETLGLSNELTDTTGEIKIRAGILLMTIATSEEIAGL